MIFFETLKKVPPFPRALVISFYDLLFRKSYIANRTSYILHFPCVPAVQQLIHAFELAVAVYSLECVPNAEGREPACPEAQFGRAEPVFCARSHPNGGQL